MKGDIWAIGVMIYELLVGVHPFERTTELMTFDEIKKCKWKRNQERLSKETIELLELIFVKEEDKRPTAS